VVSDGIGVEPKTASLYLARGVLYVQLADYEKAEADFETAHQLDPGQSLSSAAQGLVAAQQNDLDRALAAVQNKLARKPNDAYLLYLQADFLAQKGAEPNTPAFQTALQSAKKAVALQPGLGDARVVLAKLYMQSGKYQDAAAECRKALEINPKDQTAVYRLIQALRKTGNQKELPDLLKQLAQLRKQAAKEEGERNRYRLVEGNSQPTDAAQP
jgi:tetratricopeptide (TPR) repeat protein